MSEIFLRVWDPLVRLVHWSVAALVVIDLLNEAGANPWHRYFGYAAGALVVARLCWGFLATGHARHAVMAASAKRALAYVRSLIAGRAQKHVGHNPLGALMAYALWSLILVVALTGWALQLERFWGDEWLQDIHSMVAYALAACVCVHVAAIFVTSVLQRQNLAKSMITGRKKASGARTDRRTD